MEKRILEFIFECQQNIVNIQDLGQFEEIVNQLISIIYYLIEQYTQALEEEALKSQQLQQELSEIQILYNNANQEIESAKRHHQEHLEEFAEFEVKVIEEEKQIKQQQENEIFMMKSNHRDMVASLKLQNQYIQEVSQQNESKQQEINELMKKIVSLKNFQTNLNTDLNNSLIISQQSIEEINDDAQESLAEVLTPNQQTSIKNIVDVPTKQNSDSNIKTYSKKSTKSIKYICHSKNQSINWVKLAIIVQTLKSQQQSSSNTQTQLKEQDRLSKDLSTCDYTPYSFNSKNPYEIFFSLQCQCVKLDLNKNQYYLVNLNHLYQQFIENSVPFHKWYGKIKNYILEQFH